MRLIRRWFITGLTLGLLLTIKSGWAATLYVSNTSAGTITRIDGGNTSTFASGLSSPTGLTFDNSGVLYVANSGDGTISQIDSTGTVSPFGSGFVNPSALTTDPTGNLYVATPDSETIWKISTGGGTSVFATGVAFNADGAHLSSDAAGNIYANTTSTIEKFDSLGNRTTVVDTLNFVEGMAVDAAGQIYFAHQNPGFITSNGPTSFNLGIPSYPAPFNADPLMAAFVDTPSELAFDREGNLFAYFGIANDGVNDVPGVIIKFGSDGNNSLVATNVPGTSGNTGYLAIAVPEPSVLWHCAIGCMIAAGVRRVKKFAPRSNNLATVG